MDFSRIVSKKKKHCFTDFQVFFSINVAAGAAKYCRKEAVNQSAASAASPDYAKFQAVIKSAASAASEIQGTQVQGSAGRRGTVGRRGRPDDGSGAPLDLGSLDLGGCASSRLDHGLKAWLSD